MENITFEQIDAMTITERNQYIKIYGEILKERINQLQMSEECKEQRKALEFNQSALIHITTSTGEFKEFKNEKESSARLKNLVSSLKAAYSTIEGIKEVNFKKHQATRNWLNQMGIIKQYTDKELDIIDYVSEQLADEALEEQFPYPHRYPSKGELCFVEPLTYTTEEIDSWVKKYKGLEELI